MKKEICSYGMGGRKGSGRLLTFSFLTFLLSSLYVDAQAPDTLKGPVVNITVNKETDDQGNIIRYDSTYTWFWSSGDTLLPQDDTLFFKRFFSGPGGWHYGRGMLMPDSLPGMIFSPFDEELDPFFFGFPDTEALRRIERMFREFMDPFGEWPGEEFFHHFNLPDPRELFRGDSLLPSLPPPGKEKTQPRQMKGKVIIL
jgi:hypothetical protein